MMKFNVIPFSLILALGLFFTACEDDSDSDLSVSSTEDFGTRAVSDLRGGEKNQQPCFDLVYPVTLSFEDGTTSAVNSKEEMKDAIVANFQSTGERERPSFIFPINIVKDSVEQTVSTEDAFEELVEGCFEDGFEQKCGNGHKGGKDHKGGYEYDDDHDDWDKGGREDLGDLFECYAPIFPVSFTNGTETLTFDSLEDLIAGRQALRQSNSELVFPVSFTDMNGTTVTANSIAELEELDDACDDDDEDTWGYDKDDLFECYAPVFPVSFTNGTETLTFDSFEALIAGRQTLRQSRAELVFPVSFTNADGVTVTANSMTELKALAESCDDDD